MSDALTAFLGEPTEPHEVSGVEYAVIVCDKCGHEVDGDGDAWWHHDPKYEPKEASDD